MSSGAYSWHDFLEIWTSWSFVWFLFWVKALQRAFDICVAAVRVGEVFPLHKMRTQTYCVIMHFTHLSFFFYTWRKIHCNGPFCLSPCCCCALSLFSSAVLIRRLISRMGHTRARRASCIKHSSSSPHITDLLCFWIFVITAWHSCSTFSLTHSLHWLTLLLSLPRCFQSFCYSLWHEKIHMWKIKIH